MNVFYLLIFHLSVFVFLCFFIYTFLIYCAFLKLIYFSFVSSSTYSVLYSLAYFTFISDLFKCFPFIYLIFFTYLTYNYFINPSSLIFVAYSFIFLSMDLLFLSLVFTHSFFLIYSFLNAFSHLPFSLIFHF